ncbi:unnamed protein product [Gongylonema pulchrum]|uniref:Immunoglobulin I-set domain protein n=1 Tax=Gongylonema pulchrum TaxID=637853 RepID=A0A183CW15_9BILA|nr:unnamed protein product [Gongylonema pulchrum]
MEKIDDNNYVLKIEKCALDDSGTYSITVEEQLTFLKPLKDVEVVEGEQAELTVETNVHPRSVKWYKNGQEVKPVPGRIEIKDNVATFRLIFKRAEKDDAANYKVVLSNSAGELDSSANLSVRKPKGQPKIIKGLEDQVIAKGDALILEIKVEGEPTEVRWLKNDAALPKDVQAKIEQINENTAEVINEAGKAQTSGNVEVDVKPEIAKGLEDGEIDEGDEHLFRVETTVPVRQVKWYKNGQEIKASPKATMKEISPKKFELIIAKASLDDSAAYKVVLSNRAGECDSSANLTVVKPNILKILEGLKDTDVNEGEPIQLSVKVEGQPKTVKWLKNGNEITPDDHIQIVSNYLYQILLPQL